MEFHITTHYDRETALALVRIAGKTTQKWKMRLSRGTEFFFAALMLGSSALLIWLGEYGLVTFFGLLLGLFALFSGIFYYQIAARQSRRLMMENAALQEMTLNEEAIFIRNGIEESKMVYSVFCALYQYGHYYFLFLDKKHSIVLDVNGLDMGASDALKNFLEEKCGKPVVALR